MPPERSALLGYDRQLCSEVVAAFVAELSRSLRHRAKRELGLDSVADAHTGSVAAVQRTDSALRLNVHFHVLALDGVYVREGDGKSDDDSDDDPLVFHPLPTPTRVEVADVARRTAERIEKILRAHGRSLDPEMQDDEPPELCLDEPGLAACYAAAAQGVSVSGDRAGQLTLRLLVPRELPSGPEPDPDPHEPVAEVRGVNLHAKQLVDGRDRAQLERLCKYILRPPLAQDRLTRRDDGRLELAFKNVWKDGARALVLEPHDLLVRLVAAVPPPRFHLLRYFGVLSSHSSLRAEVVPAPPHDPARLRPPPAPGDQLHLFSMGADERAADEQPAAGRSRWAWLLAHVFKADLEKCPRCSGPMRWVEAASTPEAAARLLEKLGFAPRSSPLPMPPGLGQLTLPFARAP